MYALVQTGGEVDCTRKTWVLRTFSPSWMLHSPVCVCVCARARIYVYIHVYANAHVHLLYLLHVLYSWTLISSLKRLMVLRTCLYTHTHTHITYIPIHIHTHIAYIPSLKRPIVALPNGIPRISDMPLARSGAALPHTYGHIHMSIYIRVCVYIDR